MIIRLIISSVYFATSCLAQIPSAKPPKRATGDGLRGDYYNGYAFNQAIQSRVDPAINFFYDGHKPPVSGVRPQLFSVRWSGQLLAPVSGHYRFSSIADDGVRIWVGGLKVMEEWRERGRELVSQPVFLKAGQFYAIRIDYVNYQEGGFIDLDWDLSQKVKYATVGFVANRTIIPTAYLFSDPAEMPRILPPPAVRKPAPTAALTRPVNTPKNTVFKPSVRNTVPKKPPVLVKPKPLKSTPVILANPFDELETTGRQTLDHVGFRQSSYELLPDSYLELNQLADVLKRSPTLRIEISGHTDNVGDPRLNQTLSEFRAKVVSSYLTRQGIDERRISVQGYGGTLPVTKNDSEENRARNRRVEIKVLSHSSEP